MSYLLRKNYLLKFMTNKNDVNDLLSIVIMQITIKYFPYQLSAAAQSKLVKNSKIKIHKWFVSVDFNNILSLVIDHSFWMPQPKE